MGYAIILPDFEIPSGYSGLGKVTEKSSSIACTAMSVSQGTASNNTIQFGVTYTPSNTTQKGVSWKTSNSTYATIDSNGLLTIKEAGNGKTITVTATNTSNTSITATKSVTLTYTSTSTEVALTGLTISKGTVTENTITMNVSYAPSNTTQTGVTWSITSGTSYATINSSTGVITVKASGTIKVKATSTQNTSIVSNVLSISVTYVSDEPEIVLPLTITQSDCELLGGYISNSTYEFIESTSTAYAICNINLKDYYGNKITLTNGSTTTERYCFVKVKPTAAGTITYADGWSEAQSGTMLQRISTSSSSSSTIPGDGTSDVYLVTTAGNTWTAFPSSIVITES